MWSWHFQVKAQAWTNVLCTLWMEDPAPEHSSTFHCSTHIVVHQCRPEPKIRAGNFPHKTTQSSETLTYVCVPASQNLSLWIFVSSYEFWSSLFFWALDCILCSNSSKRSDVQPAPMLSFYPVSIPRARRQGFVVELFFKHLWSSSTGVTFQFRRQDKL